MLAVHYGRFTALVCLWLASAHAADPLRYRGFDIDVDLLGLAARFPHSEHQFWLREGRMKSLSEDAEFRDLIARGTGQYIIRISPDESSGHLFYLAAEIAKGVMSKLRLSFEGPSAAGAPSRNPLAEMESRHPACAPILAELTRQFGKPDGPGSSWEERLENRRYSWRRSSSELALVCGRYQGRQNVFAMDVVFSRAPN